MPRFFQHQRILSRLKLWLLLVDFILFFLILTFYLVHTKIYLWPKNFFLVFFSIFQHHEKVVLKSNDMRNHFFPFFDLSLEAKKRVEFIWVPEIMPDDRARKGQTKLNMFSILDEQIKSISNKQAKLNFCNRPNWKFACLCRSLTQTATWRPNQPILTSSITAILKAMTDTFFCDQV